MSEGVTPTDPSTSRRETKPRRRTVFGGALRVLFGLALIGLVLLVGGVLAVEYVLRRTDVPRRLVVDALRDQTGLEIALADLETNWLGDTRLEGLEVSLPLEERPFLLVPAAEITHADLLRLVLFRSPRLEVIEAAEASLALREDPAGTWNVLRAAEIVQLTQAAREPASGSEPLPTIRLRDVTIRVERPEREPATIDPVNVTGEPVGRFGWAFKADATEAVAIEGRVVTRSPFRHEVSFVAVDPRAVLAPFVDVSTLPSDVAAAGVWTGRIGPGGVTGQLAVERVVAMGNELEGTLAVDASAERVLVEPSAVAVRLAAMPEETLTLDGGRLRADLGETPTIRAEEVLLRAMETTARVSGDWDVARRRGRVEGSWRGDVEAAGGINHLGSIDASATLPDVGEMRLEATVNATGRAEAGTLVAEGRFAAAGESWRALAGRATFPVLRWEDERGEVDLSGLAASARLDGPVLRVRDVTLPHAARADVAGTFNTQTRSWTIDLEAEDWAIPRLLQDRPVDVTIVGEGDRERFDFSRFVATGEGVRLEATGNLSPAAATPLTATATLTVEDPFGRLEAETTPPATPSPAGPVPADAPAGANGGRLVAELEVAGDTEPLGVRYRGRLLVQDVPVGEGRLDELTMPWRGRVTREVATFMTDTFDALGGRWQASGEYRPGERGLAVDLTARNAPLDRLARFADLPIEVAGTLDADVDVRLPQLDPEQLAVTGEWSVADLRRGDVRVGGGRGRIDVAGGEVRLGDVTMEHEGGALTGQLSFNYAERSRLLVDVQSRDWLVRLENAAASALVDGEASLSIDVAERTAQGEIDLAADLTLRDADLGRARAQGAIDGRTLRLDALGGELLGGTVAGEAVVPVDEWLNTTAELRWEAIDLAQLQALLPAPADATPDAPATDAPAEAPAPAEERAAPELAGVTSGSLVVAPTDDPRRLEPLRIELDVNVEEGRYGALGLDGFDLLAFAGPERLIVDRSTLEVAQGEIDLWGRLTRHDEERYAHLFATLRGVQLAPIVETFDPAGEAPQATLAGDLTVGGYVGDATRAFGSGTITLAEADLGAMPFIATLYDLLNVRFGGDDRAGEGRLDFRIEGETLTVPRFTYFNRGTNVVANLAIRDISRGAESPIEGVAVASIVPFRELDLPLFGDLGRAIEALQGDAASVRIEGTLADRRVRPVPLGELGQSLGRMLRAGFAGD